VPNNDPVKEVAVTAPAKVAACATVSAALIASVWLAAVALKVP